MTDPLSAVRHATTRVHDRLTGLLLRAIGYGAGDPAVAVVAPATLTEGQMWAEMSGERRACSTARAA